MLYIDIPTIRDIKRLNELRSDFCISMYIPTTPVTQDADQSRITLKNLSSEALAQVEHSEGDKRRLAALREYLEDLIDDEDFWRYQAHSLAIFITPEEIRTFRLANRLEQLVEVSDRFHLNPLIRSVTFPQAAWVLALSENSVRLVEVSPDLPAVEHKVAGLPADAASAVGKSTLNDRSHDRRITGREGQKTRLAQYCRQIDAALRPVIGGSDIPVILAATQPINAIFRSVSSLTLLPETIEGSHDRTSEAELAAAARPLLDADYARQIDSFHELYDTRAGQGRSTTDIADAARAATFGNIDRLLVDMDHSISGFIDEHTGAISIDEEADAENYDVVDEIAGRALRNGAHVLAVRSSDIPMDKPLAAILRAPV